MTKKYNLILAHGSNGCMAAYVKTGLGNAVICSFHSKDKLSTNNCQFTQEEINELENSLPNKEMRDAVEASKVEVKNYTKK